MAKDGDDTRVRAKVRIRVFIGGVSTLLDFDYVVKRISLLCSTSGVSKKVDLLQQNLYAVANEKDLPKIDHKTRTYPAWGSRIGQNYRS